MPVDWNSQRMLKWKEDAVKQHQKYYDALVTAIWRGVKPSDNDNLKGQIEFLLFNVPEGEPSADWNGGTKYRHIEQTHLNNIFGFLKEDVETHTLRKKILESFLFVYSKRKDGIIRYPVIRIPHFEVISKQNINLYLDSYGQLYKNWQDYLENNTLPESVLCYPRNGVYSAVNGAVEVEFGISPAGRRGTNFLQGIHIGGNFLNVGVAGALIAQPYWSVALLVVAGAVAVSLINGVYDAVRNIQTRDHHRQPIGVISAVSRNTWLMIVVGVMSIVSLVTIALAAKIVKAAATMPLAGQNAINSLSVISCILNSLAAISGLVIFIDKAVNGDEITGMNVIQFASAVLLFIISVVSLCQAKSLLKSMRKNS